MSTSNLLLINQVNSAVSRRRFRSSRNLYVPRVEEGADGDESDNISISSSQIADNRKFILRLKTWATTTKQSSRTATGKGIARLVEKIAHDDRVSIEDENLILETISVQRGWWATLVVMDTLIVALSTAMLCFEDVTDNGHWSEAAGERILFAYHALLALLLYITVCHLTMVLLVSGLSTYIFEVKGILTFFVRCHNLLVHVNFSGMIFIVPGFLFVPALAQVYSYGLWHAIPSIAMCLSTFVFIAWMYVRVIRPLFTGLYNEEYDIGPLGSEVGDLEKR
ncbi:unnamed protein product [Cylindrotheca closterium]|uniref:Uncharacterized protein n=1 Tax=Cylindrotheca closterium TaxID=2856 RepID=A0AAD2JLE6_9STRA|nr:unnamed protein product [Cylindrotheca closterium]